MNGRTWLIITIGFVLLGIVVITVALTGVQWWKDALGFFDYGSPLVWIAVALLLSGGFAIFGGNNAR